MPKGFPLKPIDSDGNTVKQGKMTHCPVCKENKISRKRLILQELTIPGVKAICGNCGSHVGIKGDGLIVSLWVEIVFFAAIFISLIYVNIWFGMIIFIIWSLVRVMLKSKGELEKYE